jgi:PAS domain S-box-containing protein
MSILLTNSLLPMKKVKHSKKHSEFLQIINLLPDPVVTVNILGIITAVNKAVLNKIGYTENELIGKHFAMLGIISSASLIKTLSEFDLVISGQKRTPFEMEIIDKKGKSILYEVNPRLYDKQVFAILRDITPRKKAEREIKHALLQGKEYERNRIGMNLHDGLGQLLVAAHMQLNGVKHTNTYKDEAFINALQLTKSAILECRAIAHNLASPSLGNYPLQEIIMQLIQDLFAGSDIHINYNFNAPDTRFPEVIRTEIYRICQEIFSNSIKYSKAQVVSLNLEQNTSNLICLKYEDNGVGFDVNKKKDGIGLKNLHTRVIALDGSIDINACSGQGTSIDICIPVG